MLIMNKALESPSEIKYRSENLKIVNAGDPNHQHLLKITEQENGDEVGRCSCGREVFYPKLYFDKNQHQYKAENNKPRFKFGKDFLSKGMSL